MSVLRNYHRSKKLTKCSQVYDAVLMEAAAQCNWQILREVMRMMEEGQVPYTITSHAAFFICLGWRSLSEKGNRSPFYSRKSFKNEREEHRFKLSRSGTYG